MASAFLDAVLQGSCRRRRIGVGNLAAKNLVAANLTRSSKSGPLTELCILCLMVPDCPTLGDQSPWPEGLVEKVAIRIAVANNGGAPEQATNSF
jgi:hypothetical protein